MQGIHRKERENRKRKTLLTHTGLLMEGWRQRRPGSNARNPQEGKRKQKEKNTLDSYRPSHGRSYGAGDGNRTHVRSLGSSHSTTELRPLVVSDCTQKLIFRIAV